MNNKIIKVFETKQMKKNKIKFYKIHSTCSNSCLESDF